MMSERESDAGIFDPVGKITTCHVSRLVFPVTKQSAVPVVQHTPSHNVCISFANMHMHVLKAPQRACGAISAAPAGHCGSAYLTPAVQCVAYFDHSTRMFL